MFLKNKTGLFPPAEYCSNEKKTKQNNPAAHAKILCVYCISFHWVASNPRATGGCEPVYNQFSLLFLWFFVVVFLFLSLSLSCFYCFDEHFLITILCAVCCACMLFCFPQLFYFSRKERKKFFYFYLFPRFFIFFSSWRNGNTIHIDLHLSTSTKIRIKM